MLATLLHALLAFLPFSVAALDPITIKGSKFFSKDGSQFFIKGVAYQQAVSSPGASASNPDYVDPLANGAACARDVPLLKQLGANLIRTYGIDPSQDHSVCMKLLDEAGIYVISDLAQPKASIDRISPSWDVNLYNRYTGVVDALQGYNNVLGFFAGNEVTNEVIYTDASAFVKAAIRDMKGYIKAKGYRSSLAVGYAAADDANIRVNVANYFNCGDASETIDFWGDNVYSWCGESDFVTSQYINRTNDFENFPVPVFFAEFGCNNVGGGAGRKWTEVATLLGEKMNKVFSGGIAYEYFQEANDYGLVTVDSKGASTLADFNALSSQFHAATPTGTKSTQYTPTNTAKSSCPTVGTNWTVSATGLPPTPNQALCDCMKSSLVCIAKSAIAGDEIAKQFSKLCTAQNTKPCNDLAVSPGSGSYGRYSMCNALDKLSWAFNVAAEASQSGAGCDFEGNAQQAKAATPLASCSSLSSIVPNSTSTSGAKTTSTKKSEGSTLYTMKLPIGGIGLAFYVLVMFTTGARMILL